VGENGKDPKPSQPKGCGYLSKMKSFDSGGIKFQDWLGSVPLPFALCSMPFAVYRKCEVHIDGK
jgi:hypothetical protein